MADNEKDMLFGRNRQSVEDIEANLQEIYWQQPGAYLDASGQPCINADNLVDVIREFSRRYGGEDLMSDFEIQSLQQLLEAHPNLTCTPATLIMFVAHKVGPRSQRESTGEDAEEEEERGRTAELIEGASSDRSSSNESTGTRRATSRPPAPPPPQTPVAARPSVFDRRQRSTPIAQANPPSSFSHRRPMPASRRRSIDGATSDSERSGLSASTGRRRAPSNPPDPSSSTSPPKTFSRPHSRTASQPHPDYTPTQVFSAPVRRNGHSHSSSEDESFPRSRSSPSPPPRSPSPNSDSGSNSDEDGDSSLIREYHSNRTLSMASIDSESREEVLSRTLTETQRKLQEAEASYQRKISENESDIDELQTRLQDMRADLNNMRRQEKELKTKESQNHIQIQALEAEVARLQKSLEAVKNQANDLREKWQDQIQIADRYRDDLRQREKDVAELQEHLAGHQQEAEKHTVVIASYEERLVAMQELVEQLRQAQEELIGQKNENMALKETIDRMRFEMDELRASQPSGLLMDPATKAIGRPPSERGSVGKSLGAEMLGKMKFGYRGAGEDDGEEHEDDSEDGNTTIEEETVVESSDDEFQTETIVTRRKRVKKGGKTEQIIEKSYCDNGVQHDDSMFAARTSEGGVQTDVVAVEKEVQIVHVDRIIELEKQAAPRDMSTAETQTDNVDPEIKTVYVDRIVELEKEVEVKPEPQPASDAPPAYEEDEEERITRKLHPHLTLSPKGISREALEEWRNLKEETGVDCLVIERLLESAAGSSSSSAASTSDASAPRRRSRFYNIYNTYIYPESTPGGLNRPQFSWIHLSVGVLSTAIVFYLSSAAQAPQYQMIPGGPTVYDREAWNAFNRLAGGSEGMLTNVGAGDGTEAVWSFLRRGVNGAAMYARGWPT
ncbi:uncharacterized protein SCHCODRAFT_02112215 [Schizophyllum commune H4-8]|nr:uncharacterized protein SCHCODRAFT_02112215 [Schizophyllum commune H4-8]KAI5886088.1 hypothetical protein SCHCODRAFT_02112215 [Schizophyllum commune H4-8]